MELKSLHREYNYNFVPYNAKKVYTLTDCYLQTHIQYLLVFIPID